MSSTRYCTPYIVSSTPATNRLPFLFASSKLCYSSRTILPLRLLVRFRSSRRKNLAVMAQPLASVNAQGSGVEQKKVVVFNNYGEKLVGVLHETGSKELVILCHGFRSSKDNAISLNLANVLTEEGIGAFRFDFSGNGESEGSFQYGNYRKEADDLRAVVEYFSQTRHGVTAIVGHSKGGNVVLLYASLHHDIPTVVNISGRYALDKGIEERLGKDFMQRIQKEGHIDVMNKTGKIEYRLTEESLMERLSTDMHKACLSIDQGCRVLTVHGTADEIIPVEDAFEFAKLIPNHKLHTIEGADHIYTSHQNELASFVLNFIKEVLQEVGNKSSQL